MARRFCKARLQFILIFSATDCSTVILRLIRCSVEILGQPRTSQFHIYTIQAWTLRSYISICVYIYVQFSGIVYKWVEEGLQAIHKPNNLCCNFQRHALRPRQRRQKPHCESPPLWAWQCLHFFPRPAAPGSNYSQVGGRELQCWMFKGRVIDLCPVRPGLVTSAPCISIAIVGHGNAMLTAAGHGFH